MKLSGIALCTFLIFSSSIFSQSLDLKSEKERLKRIEAAIQAEDNPTYIAECDALLDGHRINALAYYLCGKHLLYVKESDPARALANARLAYKRLKIAGDTFYRASRQLYLALDAMQYQALAAMQFHDFDRAQVLFRQVLARDNRLPVPWYNLGVIYELKGQKEESMRAFDRYLRLTGGSGAQDF